MIDLRSDTVTRPSPAMRRAMAEAEVGDDVYGEDPTVRRLEAAAAEVCGKQAALLCPSGVMANLLALLTLARRGTEVVVEADAHLVNYEAGAGALFAAAQFRTVPAPAGRLDADLVGAAIRPDAFPLTPTSLVCVEQTHNRRGGTVTPVPQLAAIHAVTRQAGLPLYADGARIFNAAEALGTTVAAIAEHVDALMFSLSKGLGGPVGSLLVGDGAMIAEARTWRRRVGGAMRQAGVIAAAGLVALEEGPRHLAADHAHARALAQAAHEVLGDVVDLSQVETNIVTVEGVDAAAAVAALRNRGVLAGAMDPRTLRLVTHRDVDEDATATAVTALKDALGAVAP